MACRFLEDLDRRLMSANFLYMGRRRDAVLGAPRLVRIPTGAWDSYVKSEIARSGTDEIQYKHPGIILDPTWLTRMEPIDAIDLADSSVRYAEPSRTRMTC
jgi:hypothetical protein